mgnify:CR=1 FL=1
MIAILSCNIHATWKWASKTFEIQTDNMAHRTFTTMDGKEYIIVVFPEHARGMLFESYLKAPDYETLEDLIKTRLR